MRMEKASLVLTAGWKNHSTLKIPGVSILTVPLTSSYTVCLLTLCVCVSVGKKAIRALPVKCDNVERGCEWEGTVGTLDEHVDVCQFTPVPCPNQCKENDKIIYVIRNYLDIHINNECLNQDHKCPHCREKGTYANITQIHDNVCEKKKIPCTNTECTETIKRGKMKHHLDNCDYTIISCKYKKIGCDVKLKRKDMPAHEEDDEVYFRQALGTEVKLQDILYTPTAGKPQILFKLTEYQLRKDNNERTMSPSFYTSPEGYHMCLIVYTNGTTSDAKQTHVSAFVEILKAEQDNWPFTGTYFFELLNQLEDKNHHTMTANITSEYEQTVGFAQGYFKFIPHSKLGHDPSSNTQYLKDNTLYFRVTVTPSDHRPWLDQYH